MKNIISIKGLKPSKDVTPRTYTWLDIKYKQVPNVVGLNIATRPDSISDDCLEYLEELNKRTYLTIELGLQTIHEKTSKLINRCHTLKEFEETYKKLKDNNIETVVHIINGLPHETEEMMLDTVKYLNKLNHIWMKFTNTELNFLFN